MLPDEVITVDCEACKATIYSTVYSMWYRSEDGVVHGRICSACMLTRGVKLGTIKVEALDNDS